MVFRGNVESFDTRKEKYKLTDSVDLGLRIVPVDNIVGSVNRWRDFDAKFRIKNRASIFRYRKIKQAMEQGKILPPVVLYKVQDKYFVVDGNHRVSVAKEIGQTYIDAEVIEYLPTVESKEDLLWRERSIFERQTGILDIELTELGAYDKLLAQIEDFRSEESDRLGYALTLEQAAGNWMAEIYYPVTELIRKQKLLDDFPNRTVGDLFLYASYHKVAKSRLLNKNISYREALSDFQVEDNRTLGDQILDTVTSLFTIPDEHDLCQHNGLIIDEDGLVQVTNDCSGCLRCQRYTDIELPDDDHIVDP